MHQGHVLGGLGPWGGRKCTVIMRTRCCLVPFGMVSPRGLYWVAQGPPVAFTRCSGRLPHFFGSQSNAPSATAPLTTVRIAPQGESQGIFWRVFPGHLSAGRNDSTVRLYPCKRVTLRKWITLTRAYVLHMSKHLFPPMLRPLNLV